MSINNKFIRVHQDAIVEWIWDDSFFYSDNYSIIDDSKNNLSSFVFSQDATDPNNFNKLPKQLYLIDSIINKFGIVNPDEKSFLQERKYNNPSPSKFNKVKIWFPINYNFQSDTGFYLRTYALNYENAIEYSLSNFYLDKSVPGDLSKVKNETVPFRYGEKLWGKSVEIYVPAVYDEALNRKNNKPEVGTINYQLTNGVLGLSQTTPIFLDFRFLSSKKDILGETTYLATPKKIVSIPQAPEYNNLAVKIEEAEDGDYFKINGIFNGTIGGFNSFMNNLEQSNKTSYILYSITVFEENIPQDTRDIYVHKDFFKGVDDYVPVLKFTNTTATIRIDMKLINSIDSSVITKSAEYSMVGNIVAKYSKNKSKINISGSIKPKLYNSKPDSLKLSNKELLDTHLKRLKRFNNSTDVKFVPFPILTNIHKIVALDSSVNFNDNIYHGLGQLTINLTPFDNVIKLTMFKQSDKNNMTPFKIPTSDTAVQLVFKSNTREVRISLYRESNEVDLKNGTVVFKISATDQKNIKNIRSGNNTFYVTLTSNGIETNLYDGKYNMLLDNSRKNNNKLKDVNIKDDFLSIKKRDFILKDLLTNKVDNTVKLNKTTSFNNNTLKSINKYSLSVSQLKRIK